MACVFCTDVSEAGEVLFEDDHAWVVVHTDWSIRGHLMIVAKRHTENVSGLDEEEWIRVARVWHHAERALLEAADAERAIALKLGIQTPHLHVHLYPVSSRATRDEVFAAVEGRTQAARDDAFVERLRLTLARA